MKELDIFDIYSYLFLTPIGALTSMIIIGSHLYFAELRKQPGDIVTMIAITELALSIHWGLSALRTSYISPKSGDYSDDSAFCHVNSYIAIIAGTLNTWYNFAFMMYIVYKLKNPTRETSRALTLLYHATGWLVAFALCYFGRESMGRNAFGACSVKPNRKNLLLTAGLLSVALAIAMFVSRQTRLIIKTSLGTKKLESFKRMFISFYDTYLYVYIVLGTGIFLSYLSQLVAQRVEDRSDRNSLHVLVYHAGRIGSCYKAMMPIILFLIRINDPGIQFLLQKELRSLSKLTSLFSFLKLPGDGDLEALKDNIMTDDSEYTTNFMSVAPAKLKEAVVRSIINSLSRVYPEFLHDIQEEDFDTISERDSMSVCKASLKGSEMMSEADTEDALLNLDFTAYSPVLFTPAIRELGIDFRASFDLHDNQESVRAAGLGEGASGEMFINSADGKVSVKTISKEEFLSMTEVLFRLTKHQSTADKTYICRFFGLFTFSFSDFNRVVYVVAMENLFRGIPKTAILRKYDLKGSKFARKILADYKKFEADYLAPHDKVLKDQDFDRIERHAQLADDAAKKLLLQRVQADLRFFEHFKLIDYSLIMAVVDREKFGELPASPNYRILPSRDPRICFVVGIIDVLQKYTWKKYFERLFKRLARCKPSLDTSSQPPAAYSKRFYEYMQEVFR